VKKATRDHITEKWQTDGFSVILRGRFYHNLHQVKTKNLPDFPNKTISTVIYNLRDFTIFLGWRYFLECRRYQTISARGLGAVEGGPGGQSTSKAPGL
jgi:hypothetical protein